MLTSAALGSALQNKEESDKDSPLRLHLIVTVDLRIGSIGEGYYLYSALVNSGAT
jgi:hypothetical protein